MRPYVNTHTPEVSTQQPTVSRSSRFWINHCRMCVHCAFPTYIRLCLPLLTFDSQVAMQWRHLLRRREPPLLERCGGRVDALVDYFLL